MQTKHGKHIPDKAELYRWAVNTMAADYPGHSGWAPLKNLYDKRKPADWCTSETVLLRNGYERTKSGWAHLMYAWTGMKVITNSEAQLHNLARGRAIEEREQRIFNDVANGSEARAYRADAHNEKIHYGFGLQVRPIVDREYVRMYCARTHSFVDIPAADVLRVV